MPNLKLLFVEDEPDIKEVVGIALSLDQQIDVTAFRDGTEAMAAIDQQGLTFRYALLNYRLPSIKGTDLHRRLREAPGMSDLRSVLITAALREVRAGALDVPGIVGIISKPFDPLTLASELRRLLDA